MRWLIAAAAVLLVPATISRTLKPAAFCRLCGAEQIETSWAVRGTGVSLLATDKVSATPISELLTSKHLVNSHEHQWLAPQSVPDPLDEFGPPVVESLEFINAPRVVGFLRNLADFGDAESTRHWRGILLQPQYSYVIDSALRFLQMPADGFPNREEFMPWWNNNGYALYNRLREQTEAD